MHLRFLARGEQRFILLSFLFTVSGGAIQGIGTNLALRDMNLVSSGGFWGLGLGPNPHPPCVCFYTSTGYGNGEANRDGNGKPELGNKPVLGRKTCSVLLHCLASAGSLTRVRQRGIDWPLLKYLHRVWKATVLEPRGGGNLRSVPWGAACRASLQTVPVLAGMDLAWWCPRTGRVG